MRNWVLENSSRFWKVWLGILAGIGVLVLLSLFFVDQRFAQHFGSPEMASIWLFHREITEIGAAEWYFVLAFLGLIFANYRKKAAYLLACLLSSGLVVHVIKFCIGRARAHKAPDQDPFTFDPFNFHHHWQSFPSGHSQTLFTVATVLAYLFPKTTPWIMVVAFYLALTRAITLAHFTSDVFAGAAVGILVSAFTLKVLVRKYGP